MAEDLGELKYRIGVETSDLARAEEDVKDFGKKAQSAAKDADKLGKKVEETGKKGKKAGEDLSKGMDGAAKSITTATRAIMAIGVALGAREIVDYTNRWTDLNSKLINATGSQEAAEKAMKGLSQTARTTYSSLEATADAFLRNSMTLKELGYSMESQINLSDALNNSLVISGTKGQQAESVMQALSKAFATGTLRGENFNSVIANGGRTVQALADGLGVATIDLRAMAEAGELTTGRVVEALTSQMERLREEAERMPATVGDAFLLLGNSMVEFVGRADSASEASASVAEAIISVADAVKGFANSDTMSTAVDTIKVAAEALATVLAARLVVQVYASGTAFVTAASQSIAYQAALARMAGLSTTAAVGQTALGAAMGLVGGPAGLAVLASYGVYRLVDAYIDHNAEAKQAETVSFLVENGFYKVEESAGKAALALLSAKTSLTEYVQAGGALAGISAKMLADSAAALAAAASGKDAVADMSKETKKLIDQLKNQKKALGMTAREQEMFSAELKALANDDGPAAIETVRNLAGELYDLSEAQKTAEKELKLFNDSIAEFLREQKKAEEGYRKNIEAIEDTITALKNQGIALTMTARGQAIFQAVTEATARGALPEQIARIAELTAHNYDLAESQRVAERAAVEFARQQEQALEASQRQWEGTRDALKGYILEFDNLEDTAIRAIKNIAAEMAASGIMKLFGMSAPLTSGPASGGGGLVQSGISAAASALLKGLPGSSSFVGPMQAGASAPGVGSTVMSAAAAIPGWGWAAMATAAVAHLLTKGDGYTRNNAGMLVGPTPGAAGDSRVFSVDPFESGLQVQGFARRASQDQAIEVINGFRDVDAVLTQLVRKLGGTIDLSSASLAGLDEEARAGSSGTFLGLGSKGGDLASQINSFVDQLADHIHGLDESLLSAVRSAGSAEEALKLLGDAADKLAVQNTAIAAHNQLLDRYASEEQKVAAAREEINKTFAMFNAEVPQSIEQLYGMIEAIDPLTESGRAAIDALGSLDGAIAMVANSAKTAEAGKVWDASPGAAKAANDVRKSFESTASIVARINEQSLTRYEQEHKARIDVINSDYLSANSAMQEMISGLRETSKSLLAMRDSLNIGAQSGLGAGMRFEETRTALMSATAETAPELVRLFLDQAKTQAGSAMEYQRSVAFAQGVLDKVAMTQSNQALGVAASMSSASAARGLQIRMADMELEFRKLAQLTGPLSQEQAGSMFDEFFQNQLGAGYGDFVASGSGDFLSYIRTPGALENADMAYELQETRIALDEMRAANEQTAKASRETADLLRRVTRDGNSLVTEAA